MGDIVTNPPSTPNTVSDSWQTLLDVNTMSYFGLNRVSLTNWDATTTIPAVAQGSAIDIDGSVARFAADEAIGGSPADGVVYLKFVVSGATVTPELTAIAPTWHADKAGWYNGSGERYSGHRMTKAGAVYTDKEKMIDSPDGNIIREAPSALRVASFFLDAAGATGVYGSINFGSSLYWTPPAGGYMIASTYDIEFHIWSGSAWVKQWYPTHPGTLSGLYIVDGANYRFYGGSSITLHYRKIW